MTKDRNSIRCNTPIAILLATYNGERFLDSQIQSVMNQTNRDWTLFIHDDGSNDATPYIIESWEKTCPERIIILHYQSSGGACENFMSMLEIIDADYYMFCDQDDVWHSDKIAVTLSGMKDIDNSSMPVVVHTDLTVVDSRLNIISPSFWKYTAIFPDFCRSLKDCIINTATGCTMILNRKAREASLAIPHDKATMHDSWIIACCLHYGGKVSAINERTIDYRQHEDNAIGAGAISRLSPSFRLRNIVSMQKKNIDAMRMLNSIGTVGIMDFISVKLRYKRLVHGCIDNYR